MIDLKGKPFYLDEEGIQWVNERKKSMSLEEKIGQLFCPIGYSADHNYLRYEILSKHPGGLMFRAGKKEELKEAYTFLQENSKIPMLLSGNLEAGGDGIVEEGTSYGKQLQVAATGNPKNAYNLGEICAKEAAAVGCNYAFAPVVDIDMNYHNPITNVRTYGSDVEMVKKCGLEYMKAVQKNGLAAAIKHFPGDGVDEVDQHIITSVNSLSCEEWDKTFGDVYRTLIDEGALTAMIGHIAMPAYQKRLNPNSPDKLLPATLSRELLQGLLRDKLGFNGMIITDATPMVGFCSAMDRKTAVPTAIEVGCDMFLFNRDYTEDFKYMMDGYREGVLSERRLDEAITRILATKASIKLHIKQKEGTLVPKENSIIGCAEHIKMSKECADEAVTLVKDTQNLLPISSKNHKRILFQMIGDFSSNERIVKKFTERMKVEGFEIIPYVKETFSTDGTMKIETVEEFKSKYDLVLYIGNVENSSNRTTNRINWYTFFGAGNNVPWFVEEVPALFISLANPYHLLDVNMIKTYINCYSNHDIMIDTVIDKILGYSEFKGKNPIDPFCGKEYLKY